MGGVLWCTYMLSNLAFVSETGLTSAFISKGHLVDRFIQWSLQEQTQLFDPFLSFCPLSFVFFHIWLLIIEKEVYDC